MMRKITFANAINEALFQSMELSQDVIVLGQSVDNKSGIFESNLIRRVCGLLYIPDKISGEIKLSLINKNK